MSWFRGDDRLHSHRKTRAVLRSGPGSRDSHPMGLWILAGTWAAQNSTTGWVPEDELDRFDDNWPDLSERLVAAGFWWPEVRDGEHGFGFVNWEDYNPSANTWSESGSFGNHQRWHTNRGIVSPDCAHCPKEPESDPEPPTDSPKSSGRIGGDIGGDHRGESESIAYPNPIPTQSLPNPSPLGGDNATGRELQPVDNSAAKAAPKKGTRIAADWQPSRTDANLAAEQGHTTEWLSDQLERFRDYWTAKAGQGATKLDWDATWRNWIKKADDFARPASGINRPRTASSMTEADWEAIMADARAKDAADEKRRAS